jgi:hypothetical protein
MPLLGWLKVDRIVGHASGDLTDVAVLDLPDIDSIKAEHRATVDTLLPRIDAITWVVDPEKYDDERAHAYWRTLAPHADRMRFILNKADRLSEDARRRVAEDLRVRLVADGIPRPVIHVVSARTGYGIDELRGTLADAGHAKVVITAKLETDRARAAACLAEAVGLDLQAGYSPLLPDAMRETRARQAVEGALELVDLRGLGRQIRAAVLHRARVRGGSFLGRFLALGGVLTGRKRRVADPAAYLRDWRSRGALGRVLNPLRSAMLDAAANVPAASRGRILNALGAPTAEADVARVLDRAVAEAGSDLEVPSSPVWPVLGVVQVAVGAVLVFAVAWIVVLFVAGGGVPVATVDAPLLGPLPMPLLLLAAAALVSALLGLILGWHAGLIGRRAAGRVGARVERAVGEAVVRDAFAGLARVEAARNVISAAGPTGDRQADR